MVFKRIKSAFGGLFGGQPPLTPERLQQVFDGAIARLRGGDRLGAEEAVHAAVKQAAAEAGTASRLYAQALFNETTILAGVGDLTRAARACRAAAAVPATDHAARKDRLTYLMNLGELLTRTGDLDEAERVLRDSLREREEFYGPDHPGCAYGLGSLADLLLARGQANEALGLIDRAAEIYGPVGHEQLPGTLGLRAFIVKAARGPDAEAFAGWEDLPAEIQGQVVKYVLQRADEAEPAVSQAVLRELRRRLQNTPTWTCPRS